MKSVQTAARSLRCLVLVSIGVLALSGCAAPATIPASAPMDSLGHVHGLGVDPAGGKTFVATHTGVWQLDSGYLNGKSSTTAPEQVAGRSQDTMGFTIAGPGLMFASGHPDPENNPDQSPPNLGLIKSLDGASSWKTVSLDGRTDFHDLVTVPFGADGAQLRIYGYDAARQTVMVSDDSGLQWRDGAALALRKLAVNKYDPNVVYATTQSGLQVSRDAGVSFTLVAGAPSLFLIDAITASSGSFVGVDIDDVIWTTNDGASTWQRHGMLNAPPEALTYVSGAGKPWILATDKRGIVTTSDYGATWTVLYPVKP